MSSHARTEAQIIGHWHRLQRFATSMNLHLSVQATGFYIAEEDEDGRPVASSLPTLASVQRVLSMYHRIETRYRHHEDMTQ